MRASNHESYGDWRRTSVKVKFEYLISARSRPKKPSVPVRERRNGRWDDVPAGEFVVNGVINGHIVVVGFATVRAKEIEGSGVRIDR